MQLIVTSGTNCVNINQDVHPLNSLRMITRNNQIKITDLCGNALYDYIQYDEISVGGTFQTSLSNAVTALKAVFYDALS